MLACLAAAAQTQSLATPDGSWRIDFGENRCVAAHNFRTILGSTMVRFEPDLIDDDVEVAVAFDRSPQVTKKWGLLREAWNDGPVSDEKRYMVFVTGKERRLLTYSSSKKDWPTASAPVLKIAFGPTENFAFPLDNWKQVQGLLRKCLAEVRSDHGITDQLLADVAKGPDGDMLSIISDSDYPSEAIRSDLQGRTTVLYWVETNGRVKDCSILSSSGAPVIDAKTCGVLVRRGRFKPALNKQGQRIRAPKTASIRWLLPGN